MEKFRVKRTRETVEIVEEYSYIYGDNFEDAVNRVKNGEYFNVDAIGKSSETSYKYGDIVLLEDKYEGFSEDKKEFEIMTDELYGLINECVSDDELKNLTIDEEEDFVKLRFEEKYGKEIEMCQDPDCCIWGYKEDMVTIRDEYYHSYCVKTCKCCGRLVNKSDLNEDGLCWSCDF